jgi:hypothetical protein
MSFIFVVLLFLSLSEGKRHLKNTYNKGNPNKPIHSRKQFIDHLGGGNYDGYDMEHIIDKQYGGSDTVGNLVMADSSWNRGRPSKTEKSKVYGNIYKKAKSHAKKHRRK